MLLFIANFIKGSLQDELDQFFQALAKWDVARRHFTRSALSQARRKISFEVFIELLDKICQFTNRNARLRTFHNMRVFAIDGSTFRLHDTPAHRDLFGTTKTTANRRALARISLLHDVLNRMTYDAILDGLHVSEFNMAHQHMEDAQLPDGSLILLDRGYMDTLLLKSIVDAGHHFCLRLKSGLRIYREFRKCGSSDVQLLLKPSRKVCEMAPKGSPFRESIPVRLVSAKVSGQEYILMTTLLDSKTFSRRDLFGLYHQRWEVEESYKVKKCRLRIEDVSGTTAEIVRQDFHAKIFAECLTVALTLDLGEEIEAYNLGTWNEHKISITQALAIMKNTIALLFFRRRPEHILAQLVRIFSKSLVAAVPKRQYPRENARNGPKIQRQSFGYRFNR